MPVFIFLGIVLFLLLLQAAVYKKKALSNLEADVRFSSDVASCGDTIVITESIANRKTLPLPWVTLKFEASRGLDFLDMTNTARSDHYYREDLLSLGMWQRHDRHIRVLCRRRGYFRFVRLVVSTRDLLLITKITANFPCDSSLIVTPAVMNAPDISILFQKFLGDQINRRSQVFDPFTFAGIREYQPRDPYRSINWKASAKNNILMVNLQNKTYRREMTILLNVMPYTLSKDFFLLEKCISLALTWFSLAVAEGVPVRLISNSRDILTDEPIDTATGCSEDHVRQLAISLARIDLTKRVDTFLPVLEKAFESGEKDASYVIVSANADMHLQNSLAERRLDGFSITFVVPFDYETPRLDPSVLEFSLPLEVLHET